MVVGGSNGMGRGGILPASRSCQRRYRSTSKRECQPLGFASNSRPLQRRAPHGEGVAPPPAAAKTTDVGADAGAAPMTRIDTAVDASDSTTAVPTELPLES